MTERFDQIKIACDLSRREAITVSKIMKFKHRRPKGDSVIHTSVRPPKKNRNIEPSPIRNLQSIPSIDVTHSRPVSAAVSRYYGSSHLLPCSRTMGKSSRSTSNPASEDRRVSRKIESGDQHQEQVDPTGTRRSSIKQSTDKRKP